MATQAIAPEAVGKKAKRPEEELVEDQQQGLLLEPFPTRVAAPVEAPEHTAEVTDQLPGQRRQVIGEEVKITSEIKEKVEEVEAKAEVVSRMGFNGSGTQFPHDALEFNKDIRDGKADLEQVTGKPYAKVKAAADAVPSKAENPAEKLPSEAELRQAIASAHVPRTDVASLMKRPGVTSEAEAQKLIQRGEFRAKLLSYIGRDFNTEREKGIDKAHDRLVDRQADRLLGERGKSQRVLRHANPHVELHLLPSREWRAAQNLQRIDAQLRHLRPLSDTTVAALQGVKQPASPDQKQASAAPQQTQPAQKTEDPKWYQSQAAAQNIVKPQVDPIVHQYQDALAKVKDLQASVPVGGYRSKAADRQLEKLTSQLERQAPIDLTTRYATTNTADAVSTHDNALKANSEFIKAVRETGLTVNPGEALMVQNAQKKSERIEPIGESNSMKVS